MSPGQDLPTDKSGPLEYYGNPQRIIRILNWFIGLILVGLIAGVFILLSNDNITEISFVGAAILPVLIAFILIQRGWFEVAAALTALVMIALMTLLAMRGQGVHNITLLGFPAVLIIASLVIRKGTMVFLTLFSVGCVAWLVFGELSGQYTPNPWTHSVPGDFFSVSLILILTAVMARLVSEALFTSNRQLRRELKERREIERQREALIAELEAKNAELERFTYTVSHDLKSPLITISGFLGHLQADAAAGDMQRLRQDSQRITDAVGKMSQLLDELLELSRIGRMMNPPETIPFAELVAEALGMVSGRLEGRGIQVIVQPDLPEVYGDRRRLAEVLQNLVDNAAKFIGDQSAPRIEIGCEQRDGMRVFFVRDNGIGIAPQYHEQIFGLFAKLDAKMEGTGVGLALVRRIVEVHGGRIWVESQPGQGATFWFTLGQVQDGQD